MSIERKGTRGRNQSAQPEKAPAWLNVTLIGKPGPNGKDGKPHSIGGIPLSLEKRVHKELIDNPAILERLLEEGRVQLVVNMVTEPAEGESIF